MFAKLQAKFSQNIDFLQPFEQNPHIAVALSGGIDSMALLLLTNHWLKTTDGKLTAIIIDHNLRASSSSEAKMVGQICTENNINHVVLKWLPKNVVSGIQAKARQARYTMLTDYCKQNDILHLFTGHHLEDRVENFFIKLSRASGIFGLIEPKQNFINNVRICKPIFNFTKDECKAILREKNTSHVEDPSNEKFDYFRNEIRGNLKKFFDLKHIDKNLFQARIADSQNHLEDSARLIQKHIISAFCDSVSIHSAGFAIIKLESFLAREQDVKTYLLNYLLKIISGDESDIRSEKIQTLLNSVESKNFQGATLGKCIIDLSGPDLIIYKEKHYIDQTAYSLQNQFLWDRRFRIQTSCQNLKGLTVETLDLEGYKAIKDRLNFNAINDASKHRNKILFTLPVLKRLEKIVSMPNIDYYDDELTKENLKSIFTPCYVSKIIHLKHKE